MNKLEIDQNRPIQKLKHIMQVIICPMKSFFRRMYFLIGLKIAPCTIILEVDQMKNRVIKYDILNKIFYF